MVVVTSPEGLHATTTPPGARACILLFYTSLITDVFVCSQCFERGIQCEYPPRSFQGKRTDMSIKKGEAFTSEYAEHRKKLAKAKEQAKTHPARRSPKSSRLPKSPKLPKPSDAPRRTPRARKGKARSRCA